MVLVGLHSWWPIELKSAVNYYRGECCLLSLVRGCDLDTLRYLAAYLLAINFSRVYQINSVNYKIIFKFKYFIRILYKNFKNLNITFSNVYKYYLRYKKIY